MKAVHRILSVIAFGVLLYLGVTGSWIQILDLKETLSGTPESTRVMQSINEGKNGNGDYAVVTEGDFSASPLPEGLDYQKAFATTWRGALAQAPKDAPGTPATPDFVELRVADGAVIGQARFDDGKGKGPTRVDRGVRAVDALTGAPVKAVSVRPSSPGKSLRQTLKEWHRFWTRKDKPGVYFELAAGIAMWTLIITGLTMYWRMLKARRDLGRKQLFWSGGGLLRTLHRVTSLGAAVFLIVIAFSGTWLGFESTWHTFVKRNPPAKPVALAEGEVLNMADATVKAWRATEPDVAIKVLRVRKYAGMDQGAIVTDEPVTRQIIFNTATGEKIGLTEPGFPPSGFPFGMDTHEFIKHLHAGFLFGTWARILLLMGGLSLVFLSGSGLWMYFEMWLKRFKLGRKSFFWT